MHIGQYSDWFVPNIYITQRQLSPLWCVDIKKVDYENIEDTLSRFAIRANPTEDSIRNLIIKAAKMELISKASPPFRLFKDFKNFFKNSTGNHISSIYRLSKSTNTKVLQYLNIPVPSNQHEEKA